MKKMLENIKVIGWDVDQTLYKDTKKSKSYFNNEIYKKVAKRYNVSLKKAKEIYTKKYKEIGSNTKAFIELDIGGKEGILEMLANTDYKKFLTKDKKLIQMFERLKSYRHIITTNNTHKGVTNILNTLGVPKETFEAIITAEDTINSKPHPESFEKILELTGAKPEECVYIGDRDEMDIIPAKQLGMKTILVWGKSKIADISLPSVYEVVKLLKKY